MLKARTSLLVGLTGLASMIAATTPIDAHASPGQFSSGPAPIHAMVESNALHLAQDYDDDDDSERQWQFLGYVTVSGREDRDQIVVGRDQGRFRQVWFRVHNSRMRLHDFAIVLGNGNYFRPQVQSVFQPGEIVSIDLPGRRRAIQRIYFNSGDMRGGGDAVIEVWAR